MTQEDKELLLKSLCMALPYKVVIEYNNDGCSSTRELGLGSLHDFMCDNAECKPYLRSMSSMTEEEDKEWQLYKSRIAESCDELLEERITELHDWFCKKHFDYRNLIEKGLAIEAPKNMYNVK